ncbi:MAG: hypothetical protein CSB15_00710 [Clostridiales bacterium]|nr:MAG: hypothetical protein CSB15_00710 [Clostridiales bacterium]
MQNNKIEVNLGRLEEISIKLAKLKSQKKKLELNLSSSKGKAVNELNIIENELNELGDKIFDYIAKTEGNVRQMVSEFSDADNRSSEIIMNVDDHKFRESEFIRVLTENLVDKVNDKVSFLKED